MPIRLADIAESVKELLNAAPEGTFSQAFTATRRYSPIADLENLSGLMVSVVARGVPLREDATRGAVWKEFAVDIGVQKRLSAGANPESDTANPELDALLALAEQVADYFTPATALTGDAAGAKWLRTQHEPPYIPEHLDVQVFTSVITVTFKVLQSRA